MILVQNVLSILLLESELVVFQAKVIRLLLEHLTKRYLSIGDIVPKMISYTHTLGNSF